MTPGWIVILLALALIYQRLPGYWRSWVLLFMSVGLIFALQPPLTIRGLDFWLPLTTLVVLVLIWRTTQAGQPTHREDHLTFGLLVLLVIGFASTRLLSSPFPLTASRAPPFETVIPFLFLLLVVWGVRPLAAGVSRRVLFVGLFALVILLLVVLKFEPLTVAIAAALRSLNSQQITLSSATDIQWLGWSYVAFRVLHLLFEWRNGRLATLSLRDFLIYTLFFPAYTAGPIDRIDQFQPQIDALPELVPATATRWTVGVGRILVGVFKKFVVADALALGALNLTDAAQASHSFGLWALVYLYALRLYFDFSGYSDIAIGLAYLYGITLPENFDRPYTRQNLAAFWQSWHITLSQWARTYVFMPLYRALLRRWQRATVLKNLIPPLATMVLIGLWHGLTLNFLIWGIWHAVGLYVHKRWSDDTRRWYLHLTEQQRRVWHGVGWFLTFHFVVLGWVWFALPDPGSALRVFTLLLGGQP